MYYYFVTIQMFKELIRIKKIFDLSLIGLIKDEQNNEQSIVGKRELIKTNI